MTIWNATTKWRFHYKKLRVIRSFITKVYTKQFKGTIRHYYTKCAKKIIPKCVLFLQENASAHKSQIAMNKAILISNWWSCLLIRLICMGNRWKSRKFSSRKGMMEAVTVGAFRCLLETLLDRKLVGSTSKSEM